MAVGLLSWADEHTETQRHRVRLANLKADARSGRLADVDRPERARRRTQGSQNVEAYTLASARRETLSSSGEATIRVGYGDGAFSFYDRVVLHDFREGEPWVASLANAQKLDGLSGSADGIITVLTCCEGGYAPIRLRRLPIRPPVRIRGWDGITEHDLDLPTGDLVFQPNGDGAAALVMHMPSGRYRVRVSERSGTEGSINRNAHYELALWPRAAAEPSVVLKPALTAPRD
jgi:hypothetical protein